MQVWRVNVRTKMLVRESVPAAWEHLVAEAFWLALWWMKFRDL